ncbi:hypothetical protein AB0F81_02865 [Actinoplanes sp. NPDC024001]|uniref:hypothetical protein n=1 Tax=Actinoplanes sp. NPDC024001 TaxID=3154598 RepID=UPI0033D4E5F7
MTPARSVAASVVALGFASTLTAPIPAFAAPALAAPALAAPAPCQRFEHFAAQAGAEVIRINRLDLGPLAGPAHRNGPSGKGEAPPDGDKSAEPGAAGKRAASGPDASGAGASGAGASGAGASGAGAGASGAGASGASGLGAADSRHRGTGKGRPSAEQDASPASNDQSPAGTAPDSGSDAAPQGTAGRDDGTRSPRSAAGQGGGAGSDVNSLGRAAQADEASGFAPAAWSPSGRSNRVRAEKDPKQSIGGVGLGDARSVLIADGPINSAAAARILDGRVAGSPATNDLVVQQAPPSSAKPTVRRTGEKRFGPLRAGAGKLTAHARWDADMNCASADAEASRSAAEIDRITVTGAGSESLLRVPETISGHSNTAVRQRDGRPEAVASATITAGRISLADGAVRIKVLRAPELRVSMSADSKGDVQYRPAAIEVSDRNGQVKRLSTVSDSMEITVSEDVRALESLPALIEPIAPLPLPPVTGLPSAGEPESTPVPGKADGTRLRVSLGDVRQATKGSAIAARATAIKVSVVRDQGSGRTKTGYGPSPVVADLGIGLLEGAAVAPVPATHGQGVSSAGAGAGSSTLPITGPRAYTLVLAGAALLIAGAGAVFMASRRRRFNP